MNRDSVLKKIAKIENLLVATANELRVIRKEIAYGHKDDRMGRGECPFCHEQYDTRGINAHVAFCEKNPKRVNYRQMLQEARE